jgi:hypothetical protein
MPWEDSTLVDIQLSSGYRNELQVLNTQRTCAKRIEVNIVIKESFQSMAWLVMTEVTEKLLSLPSLEGSKQVIVAWGVVCPKEVLLFSSFGEFPQSLLVTYHP